MKKDYLMTDLFAQFIKASKLGYRRKQDGNKIKPQTIENYTYVLKLIQDFENDCNKSIRIRSVSGLQARQLKVEMNYWKRFYTQFSDYLFKVKGCYDNYVGHVFKILRVFFNFLEKEKMIQVNLFKTHFYVRKEEVGIVTLMPEQLRFLIFDKTFEETLLKSLRTTKDVFVFGCTTGLRCSDIFNLRFRDIVQQESHYYLAMRAVKTGVITRVKLPPYIIDIVSKRRRNKSDSSKIFTPISNVQFNKNIRKLAECAGWTHIVGKQRSRNGVQVEQINCTIKKTYRFCDLLSSHTMRRTAITNMLMLGMSEQVVRNISGHSPKSTSFYRYVNFAQTYIDSEINKMHERMQPVG
ncbi:MAG TPA: hypothetical protein DEU93_02935 [Chitinophagaceae bacterium]|nr:hypothetical protein [Chitinophagaceae bacterium]HML58734.1 tyrosine-type recombinase/integrase [Ferruginibacter sp.]